MGTDYSLFQHAVSVAKANKAIVSFLFNGVIFLVDSTSIWSENTCYNIHNAVEQQTKREVIL